MHGGIDGYSRLIVYLRCSDNNQADNVLQLFTEAVMKYSCPSRVRADRGRENTLVADYMICQRGPNRSSFICGRSVHNQRIERLWRDLFVSCTFLYYSLFYHMEETNILDRDDEVCLFCLHYVFIPRINSSLQNFVSTWNNHSLRTASGKSPSQLWITGYHPTPIVSKLNRGSACTRVNVYTMFNFCKIVHDCEWKTFL